jgi:hypothetical protein
MDEKHLVASPSIGWNTLGTSESAYKRAFSIQIESL